VVVSGLSTEGDGIEGGVAGESFGAVGGGVGVDPGVERGVGVSGSGIFSGATDSPERERVEECDDFSEADSSRPSSLREKGSEAASSTTSRTLLSSSVSPDTPSFDDLGRDPTGLCVAG